MYNANILVINKQCYTTESWETLGIILYGKLKCKHTLFIYISIDVEDNTIWQALNVIAGRHIRTFLWGTAADRER